MGRPFNSKKVLKDSRGRPFISVMNAATAKQIVSTHTTTEVCAQIEALRAAGDVAGASVLQAAMIASWRPKMGRRTRAY
jgi:hypothetical protein